MEEQLDKTINKKLKHKIFSKHFSMAELKVFLFMAIPTVISTGTDAVLGFGDRLFLSHYKQGAGEAYLNAGLVGGITAFLIMSFFIVTAGYSTALVAQFLGANKKEKCARVISQIVFFSLFAYPIILVLSFFVENVYAQFGHSPLQLKLETQYTHIVLYGAIISILRSGIGGFFIGIQKTKVVMYANLVGLFVNIPLNYVLIFGVGVFPEMGIAGAAIATVISGCIALAVLCFVYLGKKVNSEYQTRRKLILDLKLFNKLLRFGIPSGVETFFGILVFDFFIMMMSAYGEAVGSAVTIAINWDSMFFIPMMGAGFTTTSLVGNAMGAKNVFEAIKATKISAFVMISFGLFIMFVLLFFAQPLVEVFLPKMQDAQVVRPLAIVFLRLAGIYIVFDALHISMGSVLRGAGDTKATMIIFLSISAMFAILSFAFVFTQKVTPLGAWWIFVGFAIALGLGMFFRFLGGKWKSIVMVDD